MAAKQTAQKTVQGIYGAILAASKEFPEIGRDKVGNWGSYGSLPALLRAVRAPLAKYGVLISQPVEYRPAMISTETGFETPRMALQRTILTHVESGETLEAELPLNLDEPPQKMGATQTYYRRYLLQGLLALAPDDIEDLDSVGQKSPLESLRDLSEQRAREAFEARHDLTQLSLLIRQDATPICGIKSPADAAEAVTFASAIARVELELDPEGEPVIQVPSAKPNPMLKTATATAKKAKND